MNKYTKPQIKIKQLAADTEFLAASGEMQFEDNNSQGSTPISTTPYTGGDNQNLSKQSGIWDEEQ